MEKRVTLILPACELCERTAVDGVRIVTKKCGHTFCTEQVAERTPCPMAVCVNRRKRKRRKRTS
jgi:predicted RNA-binding Zn ribbon-like protein